DVTGYSPEQSLGREALRLLPDEASGVLSDCIEGLRARHIDEVRNEVCVPSADGRDRWYEATTRAKRSFSGDWRGALVMLGDVTGYSPEQSLGREALRLLPDEASGVLSDCIEGLRARHIDEVRNEVCVPSADGRDRWYEATTRAKRSFSGDWRGALVMLRDVT